MRWVRTVRDRHGRDSACATRRPQVLPGHDACWNRAAGEALCQLGHAPHPCVRTQPGANPSRSGRSRFRGFLEEYTPEGNVLPQLRALPYAAFEQQAPIFYCDYEWGLNNDWQWPQAVVCRQATSCSTLIMKYTLLNVQRNLESLFKIRCCDIVLAVHSLSTR